MGSYELTERSRRLLIALVREHIETGEPVASMSLARRSGLGVSSATVRSMLAQLEAADYVRQPHTSSGRVPTDRAYRVFVDLLLEGGKRIRPSAGVATRLEKQGEASPMIDDLLASASHLVSRAARHVGFAMCGDPVAVLQRIEFVALGGSRVLVVVISRGTQITQKIVDTGEAVRPDDLIHAGNYLNTEFAGLPLEDVREAILARLQQERILYDELLARALRLARTTLADIPTHHTFYVEGVASLIGDTAQPGVSLGRLRALLEMMEEKERLVHLLNQYIDGPGLTIVIGEEHAAPRLRPFSLIASTAVDGSSIRTVGVIGPTRMDYSRAIAVVDGATQAVSRVLSKTH